jgi:hypothetical protein
MPRSYKERIIPPTKYFAELDQIRKAFCGHLQRLLGLEAVYSDIVPDSVLPQLDCFVQPHHVPNACLHILCLSRIEAFAGTIIETPMPVDSYVFFVFLKNLIHT